MKKALYAAAVVLCWAVGSAGAATIIGGSTGDGDFEAAEPATDALWYTFSPNWFHASGSEGINFTQDTQMNGSSQPGSRGGMPYKGRHQVNNTGYTMVEGDVFSLSYDLGQGGGGAPYADSSMELYLFTATAAVDGDLTTGDMNIIARNAYDTTPRSQGGVQWITHNAPDFYTATAGDAGQVVYLGMVFNQPAGNTSFPRIDLIELQVTTGGSTQPPSARTGWQEFVAAYSLSGSMSDDADGDGQLDIIEFVHGGDPTNGTDLAAEPYLGDGVGGEISFFSVETAHTNPGVNFAAEWTNDLVTRAWTNAWDLETFSPAALPGYHDLERQVDGAADRSLFYRVGITEPERPNILFILADDLGYADVSFNTSAGVTPEIVTPQLDHLATNGTIFTSAYVVHPFCGPSRMGLMSGRYPHDFGGPFNLPGTAYQDQGISTDETLISTVLQDSGYSTGVMGKWHMGEQPEHHPNARGFDEFYGFLGGGQVYWGPYQAAGWSYVRYPQENGVRDTSLTSNDHITDVLTEKGTHFIHQAATTKDPFFLFMSYNAPHSVLIYNDRDQAKAEDLARFSHITDRYRRNYAGLVYGMDRCVGQLVQALRDTGQYEDTLIVFLSDNGGREDQTGSGDNGILRGDKGDVTEGGFRVPMFLHWPGVIPEGVTYDHPVTALDFYPTFARLAAADIPVSQAVAGKDIWDQVLSGASARPGEPIYTVTYSTSAASVGIRQDQWKALKLGTQTWKLYDIDADITEQTVVSNPTVLSNLVTAGDTWSASHVQPLWWNNTAAEATWNDNNMPHYETVFTLP